MTFFISYGFLGGQATGRRMERLLKQAGHRPASITEADVIIAHSAGCWSLPQELKAKLIIYVGLPLSPKNRSTTLKNNFAVTKDFVRSIKILVALRYYLLAAFYFVSQFKRNLRIIQNAKTAEFNVFNGKQVVMIRNRYDEWVKPPSMDAFVSAHKNWAFLSLPGSHDHIWQMPQEYIKIVDTYAKQLA